MKNNTSIETETLSITTKGTSIDNIKGVPFARIKEKILGKRYDLSVAFVPSKQAHALNISYRGKDYVPNTLAFPLDKNSGEIVMCPPAMRKEYKKFYETYQTYVTFLFIHSCLHLKGYAHGVTMERKEKQLLSLFA